MMLACVRRRDAMVNEINLNHICKIEGHADLSLKIENNAVARCELKAAEGARFFEALVLNKKIEDVQEIVSRICGICSCSHSVAAVEAIEKALSIKSTENQKAIREILMLGERIRSHATHLYFLALPDYYGKESVLQMGNENKGKINNALQIISLGNKIVEMIGGREMHPFLKIGHMYEKEGIKKILEELEKLRPKIIDTINLFSSLDYPKLERNADCLCLKEPNIYAIISGKIYSPTGNFEEDDYKLHLTENIKEYATSKFVKKDNNPYVIGAIARINNNHERLDHESKEELNKVLNNLNLTLPLKNPHYNNICQAIELLNAINRIAYLLKILAEKKEKEEEIIIKQGEGVSAVEAPRGTLFHHYKINKEGVITYCNIITPTCQVLNMMEQDIIKLVDELLKQQTTKEEIVKNIEKLIRSYDPCFSCSTHFLKVNWS